jgi:hypothetical protein
VLPSGKNAHSVHNEPQYLDRIWVTSSSACREHLPLLVSLDSMARNNSVRFHLVCQCPVVPRDAQRLRRDNGLNKFLTLIVHPGVAFADEVRVGAVDFEVVDKCRLGVYHAASDCTN